ncbi:RNA methyltransferase, TrmA family [Bartonella australis AUST/NH1]|uniref:RNA methyltransferase, TrmA family n=1 Tax=Bartonella australis (strain Aust/NH1) TaxID=1094489 RepID=M1P342_BARAA|nr:class I SAM-dependent RNA methyltransferase [Bartonella australis]AGF74245.1 RNA methyltransferase, TrmA family [Bartonella australis AUST/NH1]
MSNDVIISRIGASGCGIAEIQQSFVNVPFALPGEIAKVDFRGKYGVLTAIKERSPERVDAVCQHFEKCGGCVLQHWRTDAYCFWKRQLVVDRFRECGLDVVVSPLIECGRYSRRRITLTASTTQRGCTVGFNRYLSHDLVAIEECPVACPKIISKLGAIRRICALLSSRAQRFHVTITSTENGLDVALSGHIALNESVRQKIICAALSFGITRLSVEDEILVEQEKPFVYFGDIRVELPPGGFLQATAEAETIMSDIILAHLKKAKNVADLFSGSGTFTLRMAKKMNIHAVENDGLALASLDRAARFTHGLKTVTCKKRDLFRCPLLAEELECFDGVVFDPPRAGAKEQARELAKTTVPYVVAVSCNPATLARDLSILVAGGYIIEKVTPIDQFLWSPHIEVVAVLSKRKAKAGWKL